MSEFDAALDRYCEAVASGDGDAVAALYADSATVFDSMTGWPVADAERWRTFVRDEWLAALEGEGECEIEDRRIDEHGDLAIATGLARYGATLDGEHVGTTCRLTQVWGRVEGELRILHEHTSNPLDEDMQPLDAPA